MFGLEFTPSTVVVALIVLALVFLAVRRLVRNGMCDCHKGDDAHGGCAGGCGGCSGCGAASIELKVMSRNRDALRLYASLGFCETKKYMALPLSQNGSK